MFPRQKLAAEREALNRQQDYNHNYAEFLNNAVLPSVDMLVKLLAANRVIHRVSSLGKPAFDPRASGLAVGRAGHHAEPRRRCDFRAPHHHRRRKTRR